MIDKVYQGKGYGNEAVRLALEVLIRVADMLSDQLRRQIYLIRGKRFKLKRI